VRIVINGAIDMQRFFVSKNDMTAEQVIIADSRVHQIRDVLRMKTGDEIIVLDNTGWEYHVRLINISKNEISGEIINKEKCQAEPSTQITLYQSLLAREKFEFVLQKCTEVGISSFMPVITERSIVRNAEKITKEKLARFENIIAEAAEQSGRGIIPSLKNPVNLNQAASELEKFDFSLVGSTQECMTLKNVLRNTQYEKIALFIGPEGGFGESELQLLNSRGVTSFSLGKRILRTETASIVAAAIVFYELG
jgi:16S rRNA (uracil1498-N3)-methyltransferase